MSNEEVNWTVAVIRSLVPLPHNEIYQSYHPEKNPIGLYQNSFVRGLDPKGLTPDVNSPVLWDYIGTTIARRIVATS